MKILSASQIRKADQHTIENEPITSTDLMERAAGQLYRCLGSRFSNEHPFYIFCGMGNNGGDGLALARMLVRDDFDVKVYIIRHSKGEGSEDFKNKLEALKKEDCPVQWLDEAEDIPAISEGVIVDGILGSGLNRPLEGLLSDAVQVLNKMEGPVKVAIDIPSGMQTEDNSETDPENIFKADLTLTFQLPKLCFFHRNTAAMAGEVQVLDIRLDKDFIKNASSHYYHFTKEDAQDIYRPRKRHSYKGTYGHALLLAGSYGKMGAAVLTATAAMRAGAGLVTVHIPSSGVIPVHSCIPEAMISPDPDDNIITGLPDISSFDALAMGPGTGKDEKTAAVLKQLIGTTGGPVVLDADALNILSENPTWLSFLPAGTILTPHIGEFRRLLGTERLGADYIERLRGFSMKHRVITVLKDSITTIAGANGNIFFVNEGSPALATAGSGDVLTGIILALLANGYQPIDAALLGVWMHARAGRAAGDELSPESTMAGDIPGFLHPVFRELNKA